MQPVVDEIPNMSSKKRKIQDGGTLAEPSLSHAHFPAAFEHMFGPLPIPSAHEDSPLKNRFPHNVSFRTTDWLQDGTVEDRHGYNVILARVSLPEVSLTDIRY